MTEGKPVKRTGRSTRVLTAVATASFLATRAQANDATFGGGSGQLVPMANNQVEMRSEDIELLAHHDGWDVHAKYVFVNHAKAATRLQVGFPELRCEVDSDCVGVAFEKLRTTVDGKPVPHREGKLAKEQPWSQYLGVVWLFDVTFPPGKAVTVEHSYSMGTGENVEGYRYTTYVTKTGAGWKGSIGHARFVARLPPFTHVVVKEVSKGLQAHPPKTGRAGLVEYVLEGNDWTPTQDVTISYNATSRGVSYPNLDELHWSGCFYTTKLDPALVRSCKNLLYASKGYRFEKKEIAAFFYGGNHDFYEKSFDYFTGWARDLLELDGFSTAWFEKDEWRWLKEADAIARRDGSGGPPLPPGAATAAPPFNPPVPSSTGVSPVAGAAPTSSAPSAASTPRSPSAQRPAPAPTPPDGITPPSASQPSAAPTPPPGPVQSSPVKGGCSTPGQPTRPGGLALSAAIALLLNRRRASKRR